jgi:hypothetical protein
MSTNEKPLSTAEEPSAEPVAVKVSLDESAFR